MSVTGPVAVLGTGAMGHPLAQRLADQGLEVHVWNRTAERTHGLTGVVRHASPVDAVQGCSHVLTMFADDAALEDVLCGPDGILPRLVDGQLLLDLGTVAPDTVRRLAAAVAARGATLLDVGMLGNAAHARQGELRLYVGGDPEDVRRADALLRELGKDVVHVGPLGTGMALKLVLNLVMGLEMQALAEAAALGDAMGLDRDRVLQVVGGSGFASPVMSYKTRRMRAGDYARPDFRLALMAKDLGLADSAARDAGLTLGMTAAAREAHEQAVCAGWADDDCAAIAEALRPDAVPAGGSR